MARPASRQIKVRRDDVRGTARTSRPIGSAAAEARALGEVVYVAEARDGTIKIGYSSNLTNRIAAHGGWRTLLAVRSGTRDDEQAIHERLAASVARGREYYHRTPEVLAFVNELRAPLGLEPIGA